jgi:hypothetical protein
MNFDDLIGQWEEAPFVVRASARFGSFHEDRACLDASKGAYDKPLLTCCQSILLVLLPE